MASPDKLGHSELEVVPPQPDILPQNHGQGYGAYDSSQGGRKGRTVFGLGTTTFCLLLALVFVVIAAAVGGGVGGTLAVNNAKKKARLEVAAEMAASPIYATVTVTESATGTVRANNAPTASNTVLSVPTTGLLALDCPRIDNTNIRITLESTTLFTVTCGQDFAGPDLLALVAYNINDCAKSCASYNRNLKSTGCRGAVFNADLTNNVPTNYGTCFLKNRTTSSSSSEYNTFAGMVLQP